RADRVDVQAGERVGRARAPDERRVGRRAGVLEIAEVRVAGAGDEVEIAVAVEVDQPGGRAVERVRRSGNRALAVEWIGGARSRRERRGGRDAARVLEVVETSAVEVAGDEIGIAVAVEVGEPGPRGPADVQAAKLRNRAG